MSDTARRLKLPDDNVIRTGSGTGDTVADQFSSYVMHDDYLRLAIEVALATRRALLLQGPSGSGKSAVAEAAAVSLGWRFYRTVITSRTQAEDLLWTVDHVRRIGDAQAGDGADLSVSNYISPGVLWWGFDPDSAATVGGRRSRPLPDPSRLPGRDGGSPAVVLLDEIDKADADMPNDLLVPLGSMEFAVRALDDSPARGSAAIDLREKAGFRVEAKSGQEPLVIITSNQERDLSPAFLRRCVRYDVTLPDPGTYLTIARDQVPNASTDQIEALVKILVTDAREKANIATVVDAVRAATELGIDDANAGDGPRLVELLAQWAPTSDRQVGPM